MSLVKIQPYIIDETQNFTFANVTSTGNVTSNNANLGNLVYANFFIGYGNSLSNIYGPNVSGIVPNANVANTAYSVAVGNVTGIGNIATINIDGNASNILYGNGAFASAPVTYSNSNVASFLANYGSNTISTTGNITAGNANLGNAVSANFFIGSGNNLSNIQVANVTGLGNIATINKDGNASNILYGNGVFASAPVTYGNSNVATFLASYGSNTITTTGNVTVGNIIGNGQALTGINGSNVTGTVANANFAAYAGNVTVAGQSNITSVGTLTGLSVSGNASFTGANVYISNVANFRIPGGSANYLLSTDGAGNLSWSSGAAGSDIVTDAFTGDGSNVSFTLSVTPANENATTVNYNGASVLRSDYSIAGNVLTFDSAPATNSKIEVTTIKTVSFAGIGNISTINLDGNASNILYGNGSFTAPPITTGKSIAMAMIFGF